MKGPRDFVRYNEEFAKNVRYNVYSKQIKICLKESFSQSLFYVRYHSRIATSELLADHDRIIFPKWYSISSLRADLHGVLTTIHRNLTLLHAGLHRCFSPIPTRPATPGGGGGGSPLFAR